MNWMTVIFLFSVIVDHNVLLKCWASVIWEYDGGGRIKNTKPSSPVLSPIIERDGRQKHKVEHHISFPSFGRKLHESQDRDNSDGSVSRDIRTFVSPFFDTIPTEDIITPLSPSLPSFQRSGNRRRSRSKLSRRRRKLSRRPSRRRSRRRKKRKNRVNKRQTRNIERSLPGTDYLVPCDYSDRFYCLNGGRCYYVAEIGVKTCRCTSNFTGNRCSERDHGIAQLMQWKIIHGTTRLAKIRTPRWQARNQEDNDGFSSDNIQDGGKK
ncbi:uncharacterized protein LOC141914841 [Tubulanus polymorphus]|uniref:uncharacterized protein LOC141914841 n=1 Tax=Tubulanus polymorphus TaxID=672921 RepID=UPI003DA3E680